MVSVITSATLFIECDGLLVTVLVEELDDGTLRFTTTVDDTGGGEIADIRGIFFDLADESLIGSLSVAGADVTDSQFAVDGVQDLGNGANLNGSDKFGNDIDPFDGGVEIGTEGASPDDIQSTTFILSSSTGDLELADLDLERLGVRLTSVTDDEGGRNESLKLILEKRNAPPTINDIKETVDEAALDPNKDGDDLAGSVGGISGTNPDSTAETVKGQFTITDDFGASVVSVTFKGTTINLVGGEATINGEFGTLKVFADGRYVYTLTQNSLDHDQVGENKGGETTGDEPGEADGDIEDTFIVTVSDGELAADGRIVVCIKDDAPLAAIQRTNNMVMADETLGTPDPDSSDGVQVGDDEGTRSPTIVPGAAELIGYDSADLIDTVGSNPGADGGTTSVTFNILSADSGLKTTDGTTINLVASGDKTVIGQTAGGDPIFALTIDDTGAVVLEQYDSLRHGNTASDDDVIWLGTGKLEAVVTVTDTEGDFATKSIDLGGASANASAVKFDDDGPRASIVTTGNMAVTDETLGLPDPDGPNLQVGNDEAGQPAGVIGYASADLIDFSQSNVGQDDEGATVVSSLELNSAYTAGSAINFRTTADEDIKLVKVGDTIQGQAIGTNQVIFTIAIAGATVMVTQYESVEHGSTASDDDLVALASKLVDAVVTVTDGDGDKDVKSVDIGAFIKFEDDGPQLGTIDDSTNALPFTSSTMEMKSFAFDIGQDDEGAPGLVLSDWTDPDTDGNLDALEALLEEQISVSVVNNVATYSTSDGALFRLTLADEGSGNGKWKFEVLQDAPFVANALNIDALSPGSPVEGETLVGVTGGGKDVEFDGLNWRSLSDTDILNSAANLGVDDKDDDLNTNNGGGFGIFDGQSSDINHLEGFEVEFGDGAGSDDDEIFGFYFDIEGRGNIETITVNFFLWDDGSNGHAEDGLYTVGEDFESGSTTITLPKGQNPIQFLLTADPDFAGMGSDSIIYLDGLDASIFDFDHLVVQFETPDGQDNPDNQNAWNDGVRVNNFGTIEAAEIPPLKLDFEAKVTDGDGDMTEAEAWSVFVGSDAFELA